MRCDKCGKEALPGDTFCRACGAKLAGEAAPKAATSWEPGEEATSWEPGEGAAAVVEEPAAAPGPAAAPMVPTTPPTPPVPPPPTPKAGVSAWAVASLVLGILAFMCIPFLGGVLAIVFAAIAKNRIKHSGGELGGSGLATAGLILGIVNLSILLVFAAITIPWSIINIGETRTVTRTVATQGAERVTAELDMRSGSLDVEGGASDMFEGTFTYNVKRWEPEIDYTIDHDLGLLTVVQGSGRWVPTFWFTRNEWDIKFKNSVPLDLVASLSSGDSDFNLTSLSLNSLDVKSSSGDTDVDLAGELPDLRRVSIAQSSGDARIDMRGEYRTYIQMDIDSSSGNVDVDLRGTWESALNASISTSSGDITIYLPRDVGVRVQARTRSGDVKTEGLMVDSEDGDGGVYVNSLYRQSLINLQIEVGVSSGDINLWVEE